MKSDTIAAMHRPGLTMVQCELLSLTVSCSFIPRLPHSKQIYTCQYIFSHDHDAESFGNILRFVQPTMCSTFGVYDIRLPITRNMQQVAHYLCSFPVLSLQVHPRAIKVSLPPLYPGRFSHEKNTRLSMPAQLQCLRSGAWELAWE